MPIMRTIRVLPFLVLAMTLRLCAAPMTDEDREHLLVHFEMTGHMLAEEVRGLSPAQLEYKASPDRWSIRECVSHLAVAEPDYWRDLQKAVKAPPDMKDKKSVATDADIMWYGIDRVVHTKTGGGHEKVDTYKNLGAALAGLKARGETGVLDKAWLSMHNYTWNHPIADRGACQSQNEENLLGSVRHGRKCIGRENRQSEELG